MNFTNEELVFLFNRVTKEKEKLEEAIERKFILNMKKNYQDSGVEFATSAKPLTDSDIETIKNSTFYTVCLNLEKKLKPVAEIIMDADDDVKTKFEKYI